MEKKGTLKTRPFSGSTSQSPTVPANSSDKNLTRNTPAAILQKPDTMEINFPCHLISVLLEVTGFIEFLFETLFKASQNCVRGHPWYFIFACDKVHLRLLHHVPVWGVFYGILSHHSTCVFSGHLCRHFIQHKALAF